MTTNLTDSIVSAALLAIASESATTQEKIEMLIELADGFLQKPKSSQDLQNAIELFDKASEICAEDYPLLKARTKVGIATALKTIPDTDAEFLLKARNYYEEALPILQELSSPEEVAETQMNLGLVLQSLVPFNLASVRESIQLYQKALRVFNAHEYPQEYAILHNNIAIAYLSVSSGMEQNYLYEGLAVQTFEDALKHINFAEHPLEYAMLQNNLGNALQYLQSSHPVDNILRAISAYDEALKVRNSNNTPLEYANTISNKANALFNLPGNLEEIEQGNINNLLQARDYYQEALNIFTQHQQVEQATLVAEVLQDITLEIENQERFYDNKRTAKMPRKPREGRR
jgi:tetratricopeptide (TPR) repeat protein